MLANDQIEPGFENPAIDAQRVFRAVMEGWARPGQLVDVSGFGASTVGIDHASAAVALTLVDADTPTYLAPSAERAAPWLRFHCGCPILEASEKASFVFGSAKELTDLSRFAHGSAMEPELGARVIAAVDSLESGDAYLLTGPGVDAEQRISISGLPDALLEARTKLRRHFPAGVDFVFVAGSRLVCLPRTTLIQKES
ncbi:MAG: phosphonate C-P lyase system protein PhnH [Pseudomonadota bacterium]